MDYIYQPSDRFKDMGQVEDILKENSLEIWINKESKFLNISCERISILNILETDVLAKILINISPKFFSNLTNVSSSYHTYLQLIDRFMMATYRLRISEAQRLNYWQNEEIAILVQLILFISLKSEKREEYINNVMELDEEVQLQLIEHLQFIQSKLQSIEFIDKYYKQVGELEIQNNSLEREIAEQQKKKQILIDELNFLNQQKVNTTIQEAKLRDEKVGIVEQLDCSACDSYSTILQNLQIERQDLIQLLSISQRQYRQIAATRFEIQQKAHENATVINQLETQRLYWRKKLKNALQAKKLSTSQWTKQNNCDLTSYSSNKTNQITSSRIDFFLNRIDRNQMLQKMLERAYSQINDLNLQIECFRTENTRIQATNSRKHCQIYIALKHHKQFKRNSIS